MANLTKPQGLSCKKPFFVNYAKMLCKHNYVNHINEESGGSREAAQSAICGRGRKNRAQYIGSAPDGPQAVRGGLPRQGFLGETKNFVILTMLFFCHRRPWAVARRGRSPALRVLSLIHI